MKKVILSLILLLAPCITASLCAQQHREKFSPEEFKAKLEGFITAEAGFTSAEAQAFFPIYFEMKGKQRQLQHEVCQLKKNAPTTDNDKEYALVIQKIKDLGVEMAKQEVTYYKSLCKAVPARKVYAAMRAEDRFHRIMLEDFGHRQGHPGKDRPKRDKH